jgi:hypothetical protein
MVILATIFMSLAIAASAQAYLHVENAQNYARAHMWKTLCNYSYARCTYPRATGWYQRISSSAVRVEVSAYYYPNAQWCARVFQVNGSDASPYISSSGSSPYYYCRAAAY